MEKINVIYWSGSGNTTEMAKAVGEGIKDAGKEAEVIFVSDAKAEDLREAKVFALGCPSMGAENLEETEMEPFVMEVEKNVKGKMIGLFGSYGWGGGQWMSDWKDRMEAAGAIIVGTEGIICNDAPDTSVLEECKSLGRQLAECLTA